VDSKTDYTKVLAKASIWDN